MNKLRQQILILHLRSGDLASATVGWARYDGTMAEDEVQMQAGDELEPPYSSVLAAMRDGWQVIQISPAPERSAATGTGQLANEYVLQRMVSA